jgi:hypothetical protein
LCSQNYTVVLLNFAPVQIKIAPVPFEIAPVQIKIAPVRKRILCSCAVAEPAEAWYMVIPNMQVITPLSGDRRLTGF